MEQPLFPALFGDKHGTFSRLFSEREDIVMFLFNVSSLLLRAAFGMVLLALTMAAGLWIVSVTEREQWYPFTLEDAAGLMLFALLCAAPRGAFNLLLAWKQRSKH